MYKLYSGFIGVLIAIMITINGSLANGIGNYSSTVLIHVVGLIAISVILIIKQIKIRHHRNIPFYLYSAGAIGVFTVLFNNLSFSKLGVSLTVALGLLGQTLASLVIDHYGLLGVPMVKLRKEKFIGIILVALGITIMTLY